MKKVYLTKLGMLAGYNMDYGGFNQRREYIKMEDNEFINYLSKAFDKKRKTEFIMDSSVSENLVNKVKDIFLKTKIKITFEDKFFEKLLV